MGTRKNKNSTLAKLSELAEERLKEQYSSIPDYAIPKKKYTDKTSNGLTKCVVDFVNFNNYQAERINSTGRQINTRKRINYGLGGSGTVRGAKWIKSSSQNGTADISATIKGRSVKIEIKCKATGDKYQSQAQKDYQTKVQQAGGVYIIVRTFEGFYNWYQKFTTS